MIQSYKTLERMRKEKPLVHHITNWVTIYDCAHVTRCIGALPVMAHAKEEVAQMTGIAQALVLNIGTLTPELVEAMILAGRQANQKTIPIVLDAVGAGATDLRTEKVREIIDAVHVDIIKGNAGEIATLAGVEAEVKGVESMGVEGDPVAIAKQLALARDAVVVVTGESDLVADANGVYRIRNGHAMMACVVGTGCMAASVIASFAAVRSEYGAAAAEALACYGVAGELAAEQSGGPGTFRARFFDELFHLNERKIHDRMRVERL
ncbi:MAG: hydroxyethylthiazole kinase [Candidatus Latescibacteria bacterium]|nr:hydroxyethylthiazole kinase [Candidatus Latescibacterota bacterium]